MYALPFEEQGGSFNLLSFPVSSSSYSDRPINLNQTMQPKREQLLLSRIMPCEGCFMAKKIYVGNMSYATSEEELRELFSQYGNVLSTNIIIDRETHRPKGFGFVEMEEDEAAEAAISQLDGQEFGGRNLRVNEAIAKPRPNRSYR